MKKIFKQTGIALSIALITSGFAIAQEAGTVVPAKDSKEVLPVVSNKAVEAVEAKVKEADIKASEEEKNAVSVKTEAVEAPKLAPVKKVVRKKVTPKEIKMVSKGNYAMPLQNVSTDEHNNIVSGIVEGLHVTPIVKLPDIYKEQYYAPLDMTVNFPFKDATGSAVSDNALVSKEGKNLNVYKFTSDFSRFEAVSLNAFTDTYSTTHRRNECEIIVYQYQALGDSEQVVDKFYLNKGIVGETQNKKGCKKDDTNKKETSMIDENNTFLNITFKRASASEGKNQDFTLLAMKNGKPAIISSATTYILGNNFDSVSVIEGVSRAKTDSIFFNNLNLKEGDYTFVIKYVINDKEGQMLLPKTVVKSEVRTPVNSEVNVEVLK